MIKFCCSNFSSKKHKGKVDFYTTSNNDVIIRYYPKTREYFSVHSDETGCDINYCQWCGKKMPKPLVDEWYKILEEEYGILDPVVDDADKVPKEFKTDAWWKKRGL
ncbi:MAG: hypothetical protein KBC27_00200 [Rickettsiales bacterium]|nr:hypothetical protein [Rickettsiales bacterium]